jgi:hypothetical protein
VSRFADVEISGRSAANFIGEVKEPVRSSPDFKEYCISVNKLEALESAAGDANGLAVI